ncbi:hypothetical protein PR202_gb20398 [Eleusine coracana subsp. coracana]|uniref:Uncharacterized protein n=1 Tax=Eleusine coracana subsp. coracana TaxID=191504 RepID=A0AAV5FCG4_ELECO|nr:hypothetical protein PR202_gb20398 [Eleusine coracana subsp. coracana]
MGWVINTIKKCHQGFFWASEASTLCGKCTVSWPKVTRPYKLGGLGVPELQIMGFPLCPR